MWQETNPQNYRNFEEFQQQATNSQGQQQQTSRDYRRSSKSQASTSGFQWRPVDQDYKRWQTVDEDGNQTEVEEVVMVGMKPVMMGFGMGDGTGAVNPMPRIFSLMKDHRFVVGLIIGAALCFFAMDASLSSMRNHSADLVSENEQLTKQVESLEQELDSLRGQSRN